MNLHKKLECYNTLGWRDMPGTNNPAYWVHSKVQKNMKCCLLLMNGPNKPVCFITPGRKGLTGINTVAYWAQKLYIVRLQPALLSEDPVKLMKDLVK